MTGEYRRWRAIGLLAAALLMVLGAGQTWHLVAQQAGVTNYVYQSRITALELNLENASARIRPGSDGTVTVSQTSRWTLGRPRITRELDGTVLKIDMRCPGVVPVGSMGCDADFDITAPVNAAVRVRGSSTDTTISGLTGDLNLNATSGTFHLFDVSGRLSADVTSGSVTARGVASAEVRTSVSSGSADLAFVTAPHLLSMAAGSGSVRAALPRGTGYRLAVTIGSGSHDVDSALDDPGSTNTITASAGSGSVTLVRSGG
ncbi:DUF4097 domain-containing protein [Kitasatospora sp. RB6PN24]|uniref:DUF4097 family beta strand repeat-containing protein n=1 Tax=Kitasatospora humi TaxID=2893891 RepID=UPI001E61E5FD|nr:DUF4097 family beta strand repeat-containing protein [Kitasatospora humi]MCC9309983.1 DUF4097 domain-containing protein [Kitasatospora humi]